MRYFCAFFVLFSGLLRAGEVVVLTNGSRLSAERHELTDSKVRVFMGGGSIELDPAQVQCFEVLPAPPVPSQAPVAAVPAPVVPLTPKELANAAAAKYGLDPKILQSMMLAESGNNPKAISPKG